MRTIPAAEADKRVSHAPRDTRKRGLTHADVVATGMTVGSRISRNHHRITTMLFPMGDEFVKGQFTQAITRAFRSATRIS